MGILDKLFSVKDQNKSNHSLSELKDDYKQMIGIAWPSTVEGALMSIIGSVDTMMVGTISAAAIAAVGITGQPRMILLVLAQAICMGTTALCARRKGAGDQKAANDCLNQSLLLITFVGLVISILGYFGAGFLMNLAGANADTYDMCVAYFKIIAISLLPNCWTLCICAAMRGIGKTKITMVTNISANVVNVIFNYILINGKLGMPKLGVVGAAIATLMGTCVGSVIAFCMLFKKDGYFSLRPQRFDSVTIAGLWKVGSSSILESVFLRIGFFINNRLVAGIGTDAFAAFQITSQVTSLSFTLGDGVAAAGTSLVGQALGAKKKERAATAAGIAYKVSMVVSLSLMVLIFIFRRGLGLLFTTEENIIAAVTLSLYVVIIAMPFQNGRVVRSGCLRGAGDVKFVAIVALISVAVLRPLMTWFFCYPMDNRLPGMQFAVLAPWISFLIDAVVRDTMLNARIKKYGWLNIELR